MVREIREQCFFTGMQKRKMQVRNVSLLHILM